VETLFVETCVLPHTKRTRINQALIEVIAGTESVGFEKESDV